MTDDEFLISWCRININRRDYVCPKSSSFCDTTLLNSREKKRFEMENGKLKGGKSGDCQTKPNSSYQIQTRK